MAAAANIRRFRWTDLEAFTSVFNEVNGFARSEAAYDLEFMRQTLSQPSCRPEENCYLAEDQDRLVGFALIAPELPIGRAVASGGVLERYRNRGTGRSLLKVAVGRAADLGVSVLHVGAPSDRPDAAHMLGSEGFRPVQGCWLLRWEGDEAPEVELPRGISLRSFRMGGDEGVLTDLQNAAFAEHWGFCPNTLEEIDARVRSNRCYPEGIIFAVDGDQIAGYNWTLRASTDAGSIGWIAMTGVRPEYRGRGLGRAVVAAGMKYLKLQGVACVELEVVGENLPATELYHSLGFEKISRMVWYERRLSS